MQRQSEPTATPSGSPKRGKLALAVLLVPLTLGVAMPAVLMLWETATPTATVLRGEAGAFVSATSSPGGFAAPNLTSVQTTTGSITVSGIFSAPHGRALNVARTNKGGLQLCAVGTSALCMPLAGDWPGSVTVTSDAERVFDFTKHGLDYSRLGRWLLGGILLSFFAMIAALLIAFQGAPDCDTDEPSGCTGGESR